MKAILTLVLIIAASAVAQIAPTQGKGSPPQTPNSETKKFTSQFICATPWKFDHPDTKNVPLKLRVDGTCESRSWKGLWTQTAPREITLVIGGGKRSVLVLSEDGKTYTGTHFDGNPVSGKRVGDIPPIPRY